MAATATQTEHTSFPQSLWNDLICHRRERGGTLTLITGQQGCGKTTAMLNILLHLNAKGETCIWRGREISQIFMLPQFRERTTFFFHKDDDFRILDIRGDSAYNITDSLTTQTYKNPLNLLKKLSPAQINVVYEPSEFYFTGALLEEVQAMVEGYLPKGVKETPQRSTYFWYEIMNALITKKSTTWYALFLDEADEIFPSTPPGLAWKLAEWAKDTIKDFRKRCNSLIMSSHSMIDMDYRILSKMQFFCLMKGASTPKAQRKSIKDRPMYLSPGEAILTNGFYGTMRFQKLPKNEYGITDMVVEVGRKEEAIINA